MKAGSSTKLAENAVRHNILEPLETEKGRVRWAPELRPKASPSYSQSFHANGLVRQNPDDRLYSWGMAEKTGGGVDGHSKFVVRLELNLAIQTRWRLVTFMTQGEDLTSSEREPYLNPLRKPRLGRTIVENLPGGEWTLRDATSFQHFFAVKQAATC